VHLALVHDPNPKSTEEYAERFQRGRVLDRLRFVASVTGQDRLLALDAGIDPLIPIGMEIDDSTGQITKSSYGVFNLSWQAQANPNWPECVEAEVEEVRRRIQQTHKAPLRYLIWAGMGGSIEDKSMYSSVGLLHKLQFYALDSTDPAKLKFILADMQRKATRPLASLLRSTLVVGMAMGMTSYEPVVNLQKLAALYKRYTVDSTPNFLYLTLPGSLLDQFAGPRGYRRVELQLDNQNTTAGRHSGPLTRGSLYPLALAGVNLRSWIQDTFLSDDEIDTAWRLAAFVHSQGTAGRDKITLLLPKAWEGAALWTKQDFEESLGKREDTGLKIVIDEKVKLANYRSPKQALQDRVFLAVQFADRPRTQPQKTSLLRRAGYPLAVLTFPVEAHLSRYMQFMHYVVFGLAFLREMNFVTQPGVELYKSIANELHEEAQRAGGIESTRAWQEMTSSRKKAEWAGGITLYYGDIQTSPAPPKAEAPEIYGAILKKLASSREIRYAELTFFGDTRYNPQGRLLRKTLDRAAEELFRSRWKMAVDIYEGPAMNHSYHEMIIGHGKCFSTVLLSQKQEEIAEAGYQADYHVAQFLATKMALAQKKRAVVAITVPDLGEKSRAALAEFFKRAARFAGRA